VAHALRCLHFQRPKQLDESVIRRKPPGRRSPHACDGICVIVSLCSCQHKNYLQGQFPGNIDNVYNQFSVFGQPVKAQCVS
jgi:hypothetical protein